MGGERLRDGKGFEAVGQRSIGGDEEIRGG